MTFLRRILAFAVIGTVLGLLVPAAAHAEPVQGSSSELIPISWDGPTTNLDWDSSTYATAEGTFVGNPVVVPGDRIERTAKVRNAGPSAARATVQITDVTSINADDTVNTGLENLIHVYWSINGYAGDETWKDARLAADSDGVSYTVNFPVPQGGEFTITTGAYFPVEATEGKNAGNTSSVLSFRVRVTMAGDTGTHVSTGGTAHPSQTGFFGLSLLAIGIIGVTTARLSRRYSMPL